METYLTETIVTIYSVQRLDYTTKFTYVWARNSGTRMRWHHITS